jgi:hypothetical protein
VLRRRKPLGGWHGPVGWDESPVLVVRGSHLPLELTSLLEHSISWKFYLLFSILKVRLFVRGSLEGAEKQKKSDPWFYHLTQLLSFMTFF